MLLLKTVIFKPTNQIARSIQNNRFHGVQGMFSTNLNHFETNTIYSKNHFF